MDYHCAPKSFSSPKCDPYNPYLYNKVKAYENKVHGAYYPSGN